MPRLQLVNNSVNRRSLGASVVSVNVQCTILRLVFERRVVKGSSPLNTDGRVSDVRPVRASFWRTHSSVAWARS